MERNAPWNPGEPYRPNNLRRLQDALSAIAAQPDPFGGVVGAGEGLDGDTGWLAEIGCRADSKRQPSADPGWPCSRPPDGSTVYRGIPWDDCDDTSGPAYFPVVADDCRLAWGADDLSVLTTCTAGGVGTPANLRQYTSDHLDDLDAARFADAPACPDAP